VLSTKPSSDKVIATPQDRVSSEDLLGSRKELVIIHSGREYRLRLTQNGKLILTASPCGPQS
jgi:hemin uptake protein HemP